MVNFRYVLALTALNLAAAAFVFIPAFLVGMVMTVAIVGLPVLDGGVMYQAGAAVVLALGMAFPVAIGSLANSAALAVLLATCRVRRIRLAALLLAPLVPGVPVLLRIGGWLLFTVILPTAIATVAYGLATGALISRRPWPLPGSGGTPPAA